MTTARGDNPVQRKRPYWLLFALVLFLAGQCLSSAHWHDSDQLPDAECALCLLSSANSGAMLTDAWLPLVVVIICAPIFFYRNAQVRRIAQRFYDSQAPPSHS